MGGKFLHQERLVLDKRNMVCLFIHLKDDINSYWSEAEQGNECLQPKCSRPRHTEPTSEVMVWEAVSYGSRITLFVIPNTLTADLYVSLVIQPIVLPFMNNIQGGVFQLDNARPHIVVGTQRALQNVGMLPWLARSPDMFLNEHVWYIFGRLFQHHPQRALTVPVLTQVHQKRGTPHHKKTFGTCMAQ
ncbi:uncharacterized protein TNCV_4147331 [Trichonephila clavipes]|nr:uncharacterized protein TNCV_4147331 [Trichonephila clavipes]